MSPATDWKETVPPGEAERFERHAEALRDLAVTRAGQGKPDRALHAKPNLGVVGAFTVLPDLPEHARVGLFAAPATYGAYVRFSNGASARQADGKPDVRGVALKLLGVPGKKLIPGLEDKTTQDFLLIRSPATPFRDADEFVGLVRAAARPWRIPAFAFQIGLGRLFTILGQLRAGLGERMTSVATTGYHSALPIKFGPYAVHYALAPQAAPDPGAALPRSFDALGEELAERLRGGPVTYDFRVQFFLDATRTPIEDASVEWKEADAPFLTVARLVLPQQDAASGPAQKIAEKIEALSFDPWHALPDHRPLGNMMRARNHAYRLSTQARGALPEPDETEAAP
jgi:hypothetical protein